jgi:polyphosphate kinase
MQEVIPQPEAAPVPAVDLADRALYVNRQISWLAFNERVLDQALDGRWPLLERVKFLAIFASNLDEFFMIRVAGLHEQLDGAAVESGPERLPPREQLTRIGQITRRHLELASRLLAGDLLPALADQNIHIRDWRSLGPEVRRSAREYFRRAVFPVLTPLAVDPGHPFPFLSNLSISLAVEARDPATAERKFARVKVPEILPRFIPLATLHPEPDGAGALEQVHQFLPLEQLIAANLQDLFPGLEILGCYPFRVTRDMDLSILDEEVNDILSTMDREIRRRRFGACVRLEVDVGVPARIRRFLLEKLEIEDEDLYESAGLLGLSALMTIASLPRPDLRDPPFTARIPAELCDGRDVFAAIRQGDLLLHHPYDSFAPVLDFLRCAAEDPQVLAIKMTLYRAGSTADAVRTLVRAAENRKQVAVSIELKARFDEENNIAWARSLERAGAHVFYGDAILKTHAKVVLVVRREGDELQRYVHLSTGNYNAGTAKLYTDLGLLTCDAHLGEDATELFNSLSGFSRKPRYRKLAVAPTGLTEAILDKIEEQAERARQGRPAAIFAKLNSLIDVRVIQALYRASMAGVSIDLCVRGICGLRPGMAGISHNIRVFSIIGRFLEHERLFVFGVKGEEKFYLASADWMPRNLDRRVEVMFPVEAERLREQIRLEVIEPALLDNTSAYEMDADGNYARRTPGPDQPARTAQVEVLAQVLRRPLSAAANARHDR